jgi:hypothetical protein
MLILDGTFLFLVFGETLSLSPEYPWVEAPVDRLTENPVVVLVAALAVDEAACKRKERADTILSKYERTSLDG